MAELKRHTPGVSFFDRLSSSGRELVPVAYRFITCKEGAQVNSVRLTESAAYRSKGYECRMFYKPISRCLVDE